MRLCLAERGLSIPLVTGDLMRSMQESHKSIGTCVDIWGVPGSWYPEEPPREADGLVLVSDGFGSGQGPDMSTRHTSGRGLSTFNSVVCYLEGRISTRP